MVIDGEFLPEKWKVLTDCLYNIISISSENQIKQIKDLLLFNLMFIDRDYTWVYNKSTKARVVGALNDKSKKYTCHQCLKR